MGPCPAITETSANRHFAAVKSLEFNPFAGHTITLSVTLRGDPATSLKGGAL
jgi:hypothetical protein